MFDHSFDERLGELAHIRFHRTKVPEIVDAFGCFTVLEIAPKMILDRGFTCFAPFTHGLFGAQIGHDVGDFDGGAGCFRPAIDFVFETAFARLGLIGQTKDDVDHGNAMLDGDLL